MGTLSLPKMQPVNKRFAYASEITLDGHQLRTLREERSVVKKRFNFELSFRRYGVGRDRDGCIAAATKG